MRGASGETWSVFGVLSRGHRSCRRRAGARPAQILAVNRGDDAAARLARLPSGLRRASRVGPRSRAVATAPC